MILGGFGAPLFLFLAGVSVALSAGSKVRRGLDAKAASGAVVEARAPDLRSRVPLPRPGDDRQLGRVAVAAQGRHPQHHGSRDHGGRGAVGRDEDDAAAALVAFALATLALDVPDAAGPCDVDPGRAAGSDRRLPASAAGVHQLRDLPVGRIRVRRRASSASCSTRRAARRRASSQPVVRGWRRCARARRLRRLVPAEPVLELRVLDHPRRPSSSSAPACSSSPSRPRTCGIAVHAARPRFSPLQQLGRTSLFIYWIHIELIYGLMVRPLHKSLTLRPGMDWCCGLRAADAAGVAAEGASRGGVEGAGGARPGRTEQLADWL